MKTKNKISQTIAKAIFVLSLLIFGQSAKAQASYLVTNNLSCSVTIGWTMVDLPTCTTCDFAGGGVVIGPNSSYVITSTSCSGFLCDMKIILQEVDTFPLTPWGVVASAKMSDSGLSSGQCTTWSMSWALGQTIINP